MQIQDLSFKLNNQVLDLKKYKCSVEVFSLDNVYTVNDGSFVKENNTFFSDDLVWGEDQKVKGSLSLTFNENKEYDSFKIKAEIDTKIRGVKLRFDDLPLGKIISLIDKDHEVTEYGSLYRYPEGWRSVETPLMVFELANKEYLYIRIPDTQVREKRFFLMKTSNNTMRLDLVIDEEGYKISNIFELPEIEIAITKDIEAVYEKQSEYIAKTYDLVPFKQRKDVPSRFKDISLVVIMHMEHFTGHIFHTYQQALEDIKKLTKKLDGKHILVYLTGWEGRYYFKYGNYTPDERLGGPVELKKMVDGMHELGCKVMAMYGINMANKDLPGFETWGLPSEFQSVSGGLYHNGSVDWDGAHHYDFSRLAQLSIAKKSWGDHLYNQIKDATNKYGFDGAFLDIAAIWYNDIDTPLFPNYYEFFKRLKSIKKDYLVAGEGFYDALAKAIPLFQSGHTDGAMHYHDRVSDLLFTKYARQFAHLCLGDPSRGSSGVHELGTNTETTTPLRESIIPTLSLVEGSLDKAMDKVDKIINQAKEYKEKFLDEAN